MSATLTPAVPAATDAWDYLVDRWQRSVLTLDVLRERGNLYLEHSEQGKPPVLVFDHEVIADGRTLEDPTTTAPRSTRRSTRPGAA